MYDPPDRHAPHRIPEVVLAEARRIAADIRRRAEREANDVRREAAEWASATRRSAEEYRDRIVADIDRMRRDAIDASEEADGEDVVEPATHRDPAMTRGDVIDLRARTDARDALLAAPAPPPETSIDTKVHDVVRHALRRTFERS